MQSISTNQNGIFEKLSFTSEDHTKIIINADDLGICSDRDRGIFELFRNGHISSATALINFPNSQNSIEKAKQLSYPIGLHLNLTEGSPIYQTNLNENTLVYFDEADQSYKFHGKFGLRDRIKEGKVSASDVRNEITQQVSIGINYR
jgi:predicted glycoside hydrolase/deacetylase ChbG (UPF0249 family)